MHTPVMFPDMTLGELRARLHRAGLELTTDRHGRLAARAMPSTQRAQSARTLLALPARPAGTWPHGRGAA